MLLRTSCLFSHWVAPWASEEIAVAKSKCSSELPVYFLSSPWQRNGSSEMSKCSSELPVYFLAVRLRNEKGQVHGLNAPQNFLSIFSLSGMIALLGMLAVLKV
jgi:hypothetical protein